MISHYDLWQQPLNFSIIADEGYMGRLSPQLLPTGVLCWRHCAGLSAPSDNVALLHISRAIAHEHGHACFVQVHEEQPFSRRHVVPQVLHPLPDDGCLDKNFRLGAQTVEKKHAHMVLKLCPFFAPPRPVLTDCRTSEHAQCGSFFGPTFRDRFQCCKFVRARSAAQAQ